MKHQRWMLPGVIAIALVIVFSGIYASTSYAGEETGTFTLSKEFPIGNGNDDAELTTSVDLTSTGLDLHGLLSNKPLTTYLRFTGVSIPKDADITNAYIVFTLRDASKTSGIKISGELGNGDAFSKDMASYTDRKFTDPTKEMATPAAKSSTLYNTEDISGVIKQMRANNNNLQNYVFKIDGNQQGNFVMRSYNGSSTNAPVLVVEYTSKQNTYSATLDATIDDIEEYGSGKAITTSSYIDLGGYHSSSLSSGSKQIAGFRFPNVKLPKKAKITDAYLEFTTHTTTTNANVSNLKIRCEKGNAAEYTSKSGSLSERDYGTLFIAYQQEAFNTKGNVIRTPNLQGIIDENRFLEGWEDGQALAFMIDGDNFLGDVYQSGSTNPPKLVIDYTYSDTQESLPGVVDKPDEIDNIYINEVAGDGTSSSKATWLELYNDNDYPVLLGKGTYISNKKKTPEKSEFAGLLIPAKGFRILYCDEKEKDGPDHANFELKEDGDLVLSTTKDGKITPIDTLSYGELLYNQTFGRVTEAKEATTYFQTESFGAANATGQQLIQVELSKTRGIYESGFDLKLTAKEGTTIKYTLDGKMPSTTTGTTYTTPININKTCTLKFYAYDNKGNSGVQAHTYVLKNNYNNEVQYGEQWRYKSNITAKEYGDLMAALPIVSVSTNTGDEFGSSYVQSTFEYLDSHLGQGNNDYTRPIGAKKFGQATGSWLNSGVSIRFHRDYNTTKAKNDFFETDPADIFATPGKYGKLELKEGEDGPQCDIWNTGYLRYDEQVTNTLAMQMEKFSLKTKYVHYFINGKYRGIKTLREDFGTNTFENYFGGDASEYTAVSFQDGYFDSGTVETGEGDKTLFDKIKVTVKNKDLQEFKKYVDVEDMIKTQILFMFIDTEREMDGILHNEAYSKEKEVKMKFNINDTDGAFHNDNKTGTAKAPFAGAGGTYRYKWGTTSMNGAGGWFETFAGNSKTNATTGNLEFKTLVKDQVLEQIGPNSGDYKGASGAPLSAANVKKVIKANIEELNGPYKLDAAFMGVRKDIYKEWQNTETRVMNQVDDRVKYSLEMWKTYYMAHTLTQATVNDSANGTTLTDPNKNTNLYYTIDGSDPMGANGTISPTAKLYKAGEVIPSSAKLTIRPFETNNWGPKTTSAGKPAEEEEPPATYTVKFDTAGGDKIDKIKMETGAIGKLPVPVRDGYEFAGWLLDNTPVTEDTIVDRDLTLIAAWSQKVEEKTEFTISFETAGGNVIDKIKMEAGAIGKLPVPVRDGYEFAGWFLDNTPVTEDTIVDRDLTLIAAWSQKIEEKTEFTISFETADGDPIDSITREAGPVGELPVPTRVGYEFNGWYFNNALVDEETVIDQDWTLAAKWTLKSEEKTSFTINFETSGGSNISNLTKESGPVGVLPVPTRDGYEFNGWYRNNTLVLETDVIDENWVLVAKWTKVNVEKTTFTIRFESAGGSILSTIMREKGQVGVLPVPTRDGYDFDGWYRNNTLVKDDTAIEEDWILAAKWTLTPKVQTEFTIKFETVGGNVIPDLTKKKGAVGELPVPTRDGYLFDGWSRNNALVNGSTVVDEDWVLIAVWSKPIDIRTTMTTNANIAKFIYDGKTKQPAPSVKVGAKTLQKNVDYTLSYGKNAAIGKGTLVITGKGKYTAKKTITFNILPKTTSVSSAKAGKKKMTVKWKKVTGGITKYQIQYKQSGTKTWKSKTVIGSKSSLTIKKLKKGKKYQVRIRACKTVSKVNYYSAWSKVRTSNKVK